MKNIVAFVMSGSALLTAGSVMLAAPGQDYTIRPGDPTLAKVWIQNTPLSVEVSGTPTVTINPATVVQARLVRQVWEYRVVTVASGQSPMNALAGAGADGWEPTGVQLSTSDGTSLLLKRPR